MQDLIEQLKTKAGLSDEQALKAVQTIKEYIQSKLPQGMQGMVDNFIGTSSDSDDILD